MRFLLVIILLFTLGCSQSQNMEKASIARDASVDNSESMGWNDVDKSKNYGSTSPEDGVQESTSTSGKIFRQRKIIYTASMDVIVEQFDGVEQKLNGLVTAHGGFIASANIGRLQGKQRKGRWEVRVPVDQFDEFLNSVGNIGVPASRTQSASDVTEEYVDIEARIANKRKLEERIIELLERPEDKLQHVIEVERELARVREDIERMEGRLRYLKDQTSLTTVVINVREERDYVPPQAPTFTNRVNSAWTSSLLNCQVFFENLAVAVVGNALGFVILLVGLVVSIPVVRTLYRWVKAWLGYANREEISA